MIYYFYIKKFFIRKFIITFAALLIQIYFKMKNANSKFKDYLEKKNISYVETSEGFRITENLVITEQNQNDFEDLTEVSGSVYVRQGATFTAPALTEVSGYVDVQEGATFTAPALTEKSGSVYVQEGATFTAPALTVSGYVYVRQGATFTAPALTEVSGYVDVQEGATFTAPALTKSGSVYVTNFPFIEGKENFPEGAYLNLTAKEVEYLKMLKPLIGNNRLVMSTWHQNENWKNQTVDQVVNECNTTHCVAGWLQIFEKDKYNNMDPEKAGKLIAPNLAHLFYESEARVERVINTLLPE